MPAAVRDNPALSRCELDVNGVTAVANHQRDGGVMTFTHTEVPPRARHGGIASQPIAGALQSVRARGLKNRAALLVRESLRRPSIRKFTTSWRNSCRRLLDDQITVIVDREPGLARLSHDRRVPIHLARLRSA